MKKQGTMNLLAIGMMLGNSKDLFYIGRILVDKKLGKRHRIFYIGYHDAFGVAMPNPCGKYGFQIWGRDWLYGRCKKLDDALDAAMKGKFIKHRHNVQIKLRANSHDTKFIKPQWMYEKNTPTTAPVEKEFKFKTRGRRRKRVRKTLNL